MKATVVEISVELGITVCVNGNYIKPVAAMKLMVEDADVKDRSRLYQSAFNQLTAELDKVVDKASK